MKLIVGLGNPEDKYLNTRHNLGFELVNEFVRKIEVENREWKMEEKFKAEIIKADSLLLVKPQTYMNHSGMAVGLISRFYKINPEDVIVIHDDLDLHLGKIKVRLGGSGAGHHGVESVIQNLGTDQFVRVRLGIGNEKSHSGEHKRISFSAEDFVLEEFLSNEKSQVKHMLKQGLKALEILLKEGIEKAQNQFN
ncbi:MAG: aminoacyl-tRNA hydrolase [Patescibacteria group bacterium]|nr:aminoacyl-tRNA hydrolase [Patescibacteria group bacterium]